MDGLKSVTRLSLKKQYRDTRSKNKVVVYCIVLYEH
jgi:hypothetical protein